MLTHSPSGTDRTLGDVQTVSINGASLAYRARGDGLPVVFVHGAMSDLRVWDRQVLAIGMGHRAVTYSRRYAYPNADMEKGSNDDPMQPHVEDLAAFLKEIDARPACLVGHSFGAFVCLLTALRHPKLVRGLVLMEPPVLPLFVSTPPRPTEMLRLLATRPRTALAIAKFGATAFAPAQKAFRQGDDEKATRAFACGVMGKTYCAKMSPIRMQQVWDNKTALRGQILGGGFPDLDEKDLRQLKAPVLLVVGKHSAAFLRHLSARLHELLPWSELVEIPEASHMMHEDNAEAVSDAIVAFLKAH